MGGNMRVTIPRALARELALIKRDYLSVRRGEGRCVIFEPLEARHAPARDRDGRQPRAH
jgi:hypothetical protein